MKKLFYVPMLLLLLLLNATFLAAQVKSYTIHQSQYVDELTAAAVDSKRGDIVVAWTESITTAKVQAVWVSYLKRNPNGTYSAGTPKMLSEPGVFAHNPTVAYSPRYKRFLVVYGVGEQPESIYAVIVKRGKVKASRELWVEEYGYIGETMAAVGLTSKNSIPGNKTAFVIARNAYVPNLGATKSRIYLFPVSKKGKNTGAPLLMESPGERQTTYAAGTVNDMQIDSEGRFYIALHWLTYPSGGVTYNTGVIAASSEGNFVWSRAMDIHSKPFFQFKKIAVFSGQKLLFAWRRSDDNSVRYKMFSHDGIADDHASVAFDVDLSFDNFGLTSNTSNTAFFFKHIPTPGGDMLLLVGSNGKNAGTAKITVPTIRTVNYTMADNVKSNEVVLVTNTELGNGNTAIVVSIIRPGELF